MDNKVLRKTLIALLIIFTVLLSFFYLPDLIVKSPPQVYRIDRWYCTDYSQNGKAVQLNLPDILPQNQANGESMLYTALPENFLEGQSICFWSYYRSVEVYLEDDLIYYFDDTNEGSFGKAASSKWNFVQINASNPGGKVLTIKMETPYKNLKLRMSEVMYGNEDELNSWMESKYFFFCILDPMLICVGLFFIAIAFGKKDIRMRQYQIYAGIILIIFSIYMQTGVKMLPIAWMSYYLRDFLCYFCLFSLALPITLYIKTKVLRRKGMVLFCNIMALIETLVMIAAFAGHALGVADLHDTLPFALGMLIIVLTAGLIFSIFYYAKEREWYLILNMASVIVIMIVLSVEYLQFYQLGTMPFDSGAVSHIGAILALGLEIALFSVHHLRREKKQKMIEGENESLRLQMLTTQIRPHFILNTLGAIRTLIHEDANMASDLLYEFSKYIRNNLDQTDYTKPIPFLEELGYIETYLKLEKARFGEMLNIEYDIQNTRFWVMPLSIQPFVENAVKHGVSPSKNGGKISILSKKEGKRNVIEIIDDGIGFETFELHKILENKKSVGMRSAILRIEKELKGHVHIRSNPSNRQSGTCIRIEIPD